MDLTFTPAQRALREEIQAFMAGALDDTSRAAHARAGLEFDREFQQAIGEAGLIGLQWPKEFGGRDGSFVDGSILQEEGARAGAPMISPNVNSFVGNTLIHYASPVLLEEVMPGLCRGETVLCLGYSEPDAGSDLAALRTTGTIDGDVMRINGQKQFTSIASEADYLFCAVRTDPTSSKHAGITAVLVPMDDVEVQPTWTLGGIRTNSTFLRDVTAPLTNVVGELGQGWAVIGRALAFERSGTARIGEVERALGLWAEWADDRPERGEVRRLIARHHRVCAVARMLAYELAWKQDQGSPAEVDAAVVKVLGANLIQAVGEDILRTTGADLVVDYDARTPLLAELETLARTSIRFSVTGGANEIQRNIIARRGLALPRA